MTEPVKETYLRRDLRGARVAETETRILLAATELFVRRGYSATTLTAVADAAGVAHRTVYVRFGNKAQLLKRAVDVAIAGDTADQDVRGRPPFQLALSAPTAAERIAAYARATREIMGRAGEILAVASQAEGSEPEIAAAAQAGREATRDLVFEFWTAMAADGLTPAGCDLHWLAATASMLAHADSFLLASRTLPMSLDEYESWLGASWTRLLAVSAC